MAEIIGFLEQFHRLAKMAKFFFIVTAEKDFLGTQFF
jgi:hypothetical protein